jgi:hypothetical protein
MAWKCKECNEEVVFMETETGIIAAVSCYCEYCNLDNEETPTQIDVWLDKHAYWADEY